MIKPRQLIKNIKSHDLQERKKIKIKSVSLIEN